MHAQWLSVPPSQPRRLHAAASCMHACAGGHLNPAVSLGMLVARKISALRAALYMGFQIAGASTGAALAKAVRYNL